jgi:sugar transferase (PEP-CTERM/EpsH1 system associated)
MQILYLSHRIPYPPNKGDKIRSFNEIKYLSSNHTIDLACLADVPGDLKYRAELEQFCRRVLVQPLNKTAARLKGMLRLMAGHPISVGYFGVRRFQRAVNQWLSQNRYDAIICFSSPMAEYIFHSKMLYGPHAAQPAPLRIVDFCDLDSDKWRQYAKQSGFPLNFIYYLEFKRLLQYEKKVNQYFDYSIFVSTNEAELFAEIFPSAKNVRVIQNGVDTEYFSPNADTPTVYTSGVERLSSSCSYSNYDRKPFALSQKHPMLLFTGAMDYHANIDAVTWFYHQILPIIKKEFPTVQFFIVGSNPASTVTQLSTHNEVKVTGYVDDIRSFYNLADISVVPLRLGRGIQNKLLEAMAMEKCVVATSKAVEGIKKTPQKQLSIADEPHDFALKVCTLLKDASRRKKLGINARKFVRENYCWKTNLRQFENILDPKGQKTMEKFGSICMDALA